MLRQIADFRGVSAFRASLTHLRVWVLKGSLCSFALAQWRTWKVPAVQERETSHRIKFTTFKFRPHRIYRLRPRSNFFPATFVKEKSFDRFTIAVQMKINLLCRTVSSFEERKLLIVRELILQIRKIFIF